jgi:hypothetical protein
MKKNQKIKTAEKFLKLDLLRCGEITRHPAGMTQTDFTADATLHLILLRNFSEVNTLEFEFYMDCLFI